MDLDAFHGDLAGAIKPYLHTHDVLTFPDGDLNAIYAAGQLTIFRNIEFYRSCFLHTSPAALMCEPGNRLWDEKYTMYHAVRNGNIKVSWRNCVRGERGVSGAVVYISCAWCYR